MSFVCESDKSAMKVCVCTLCTMWKAHEGIFHGTVEKLCPIFFFFFWTGWYLWSQTTSCTDGDSPSAPGAPFLSEITRLKQSVNLSELKREVLWIKDRNACQRAVRECSDTHACGKVLIYTHRSDRRVLAQITLSVSRSCVAVSGTWAWVCGSSDLRTWKILALPSFRWRAWIGPILLTTPILPLAAGSLWLCGRTASLSTKTLSMPFFWSWQIGVLDCLLQVVRAIPMCTFLSASVRRCSLFGPLGIWSNSFTFSSVISCDWKCTRHRSSSRYRSRILVLPFFLALLGWSSALWSNWEPSLQPIVFPPGVPVIKNKYTRREYFEQMHDVVDILLLDFATCSWICLTTFALCVSEGHTMVTRLVLYCVCDHEHFTSFDVASSLFVNNSTIIFVVVWLLKNLFHQQL